MDGTLHPLVKLAHAALEEYVRHRRRAKPPPAAEQIPEMMERAGVFVSLHARGELRGCIGTFVPQKESVAEEVIENAIASGTRDPRFHPVDASELGELEISVDLLSEPEAVQSIQDLDPDVYGVIVTDQAGLRRGLLLPMLEQVRSAEHQVAIARQKAFIGPDEPVKLYRFKVRRYY